MTVPSADLFRPEILASRRMRLDGDVVLSHPLRTQMIVILLVCIVVGVGLWIATGHYARIEKVRGLLTTDAEVTKIVALRPGIVVHLAVSEGQIVHRGQMLATVQVDQQYAEGSRTKQEELAVVQAQQRLADSQVISVKDRARSERAGLMATISSAQQQGADLGGQIDIQEQLVQSLQTIVDRYRPIVKKGFISDTEFARRQQELLAGRQGLSRLKQQLTSIRAEEGRAKTDLDRSRADEASQAANVRSSVEGFKLQQSQIKADQSYILTAPNDGVVAVLQTAVGRTVDPAIPIMMVVPENATVHVDLYAPSRAIGFVKPGQEVRLLYDAFPYERFGSYSGRVQTVSRVAIDPRQIDAPFKIDEPVYRVTVVPEKQSIAGYGEEVRLQPGMTLAGNLVLERHSFINWLLKPLTAVAKRDQ